MSAEKEALVSRLKGVDLSLNRFADVEDGGKASYELHDRPESRHQPGDLHGNYGIYAGEGLVIIDIDDYKVGAAIPQGIERLQATFSVQSPHGGEHRYYRLETGIADIIKSKFGASNPLFSCGELRTTNQYVLGPGSELDYCRKENHDCSKDSEGSYKILQDVEIATLSTEGFLRALRTDSILANKKKKQASLEEAERPSDLSDRDFNTDLKAALHVDPRLKELWEWACANGNPASVGFPNRSEAEVALAAKLWYWLADENAVYEAFSTAQSPKWANRDEGYRKSVLKYGDNGKYRDYIPNSGGGGVLRETFVTVLHALLMNDGKARIGEIVNHDPVTVGERQAQNALSELRNLGYVENKQFGQYKYWIGDTDDLVMIPICEEEFLESLTTDKEWEKQRQRYAAKKKE